MTNVNVSRSFFFDLLDLFRPVSVWQRTEQNPHPDWPEEMVPVVFAALEVFGLDAWSPDSRDLKAVHPGNIGSLSFLDKIRRDIRDIVRQWQDQVRRGDLEQRKIATARLRTVGKSFVPPTIGQRQNTIGVDDFAVEKYYYKALFRCQQAAALLSELGTISGWRRPQTRVKAVCKTLAIPHDPDWWGHPESGHVFRQLRNAKESARILTARHFAPAKETTIEKMLSRSAVST